jgi:hypothetical protein
MKAVSLSMVRSKLLESRRDRLSQPYVRSTIQRFSAVRICREDA